jgi:hypothetical protein
LSASADITQFRGWGGQLEVRNGRVVEAQPEAGCTNCGDLRLRNDKKSHRNTPFSSYFAQMAVHAFGVSPGCRLKYFEPVPTSSS